MTVKIIITILAFANGVFMAMDGFHVMIKGKYIGPEKPGPLGKFVLQNEQPRSRASRYPPNQTSLVVLYDNSCTLLNHLLVY